jgi:hypothetical protein
VRCLGDTPCLPRARGHATLFSVKHSLRLLLFFPISLLVCVGILAFLSFMFAWSATGYLPFLPYFLGALLSCLPAATILALFASGFFALRYPGNRPLSFFFLLLFSTLALAFGASSLRYLINAIQPQSPQAVELGHNATRVGIFAHSSDEKPWLMRLSPDIASPALLADPKASPAFLLKAAVADDASARLDQRLRSTLQPPGFLGDWVADFAALSRGLEGAKGAGLGLYLAYCALLGFCFLSLWGLPRLTHWQLLNAFLSLCALRLATYLLAQAQDGPLKDALARLAPGASPLALAMGCFACLGCLFTMIDLVLSLRQRARRLEEE